MPPRPRLVVGLRPLHDGVGQKLSAPSRPGPVAKLTPEQLGLIPDFLWHGPESYGFRGDVWTCERVAGVIYKSASRTARAKYRGPAQAPGMDSAGPDHPGDPAGRRRAPPSSGGGRESWPVLKEKARREHRALVFVDESGFYLLPGVVKTYGPRGETQSWTSGRRETICRLWEA